MSEQYGTVDKVAANEMVVDKVVGRRSGCIKTSSATDKPYFYLSYQIFVL